MNTEFLKNITKPILNYLINILNQRPKIHYYLIIILKKIGAYNYIRSLTSRIVYKYKPTNYSLEQSSLSSYEQSIYHKLKYIYKHKDQNNLPIKYSKKKRLAYVSPLPPLRSGISDYSATLLPLLAETYQIDVIVDQTTISDTWISENCMIHSGDWLRIHASEYDRVLYHVGNSPFHEYMFDLLEQVSGIVVLHEFFLGHLAHKYYHSHFEDHLYNCHGYPAIHSLNQSENRENIIWNYPLNLPILQNALNIISHSPYNLKLAQQFYGHNIALDHWSIIPHLKAPKMINRKYSREILQFTDNQFIVCSFGLIGSMKLNHRLLEAWINSDLAQNEQCLLIFVGENDSSEYGQNLLNKIKASGLQQRIIITGWTNTESFQHYLAAADIGVQLRTQSRGETSGALLDCMNNGLATIINAHGAMADYPDDTSYLLADNFSNLELTHALETLWNDKDYRKKLTLNATNMLQQLHSPKACTQAYIDTIESSYYHNQVNFQPLLQGLTQIKRTDYELEQFAQVIAKASPQHFRQKKLLIDISALAVNDLKTGIQRVVRAQLKLLLQNPPKGFRVEPVYLSSTNNHWHYQYARHWTSQFLNLSKSITQADSPVDFKTDDILFVADLHTNDIIEAEKTMLYSNLLSSNIEVFFQVFDLLPITRPEWFPLQTEITHKAWAEIVMLSSGALCISNAVAEEFKTWLKTNNHFHINTQHIKSFHLGADITNSSPSTGLPDNAKIILNKLTVLPSFLMVGTIEPRKGHKQTLNAFDILWHQNIQINLVIVGKPGWLMDNFVSKLKKHPHKDINLFWLDSISDEFLEKIYAACSCLIAASEGEGFGLPLIEAAQYQLPIIARDIPVFKEVAQHYAYYFSGLSPDELADTIQKWLTLESENKIPKSINMPWLTWQQSTEQLIKLMDLEFSH